MSRSDPKLVCDRCDAPLEGRDSKRYGVGLKVKYHHPRDLDLCWECENEFTIFMGKHPLWKTPLSEIIKGNSSGEGTPTREQIQMLRREMGLPPWCPECMREGRMGANYIGVLERKTDGGTEVYSCGHASGK